MVVHKTPEPFLQYSHFSLKPENWCCNFNTRSRPSTPQQVIFSYFLVGLHLQPPIQRGQIDMYRLARHQLIARHFAACTKVKKPLSYVAWSRCIRARICSARISFWTPELNSSSHIRPSSASSRLVSTSKTKTVRRVIG